MISRLLIVGACVVLVGILVWGKASTGAVLAPAPPERTPLSCDGHPADFHADAVKRIASNAYHRLRILDPTPAKSRERHAWKKRRLCLLDRERRQRLAAWIDSVQEAFEQRFTAYITPPGRAWLDALGGCESDSLGGYAEDEDGGYAGRYQFDQDTWDSTAAGFEQLTGLEANPSRLAQPREQDIRAAILYRMRGNDPWSSCA